MDRGYNEGEIHQNGHFSFQFLSGGCWPKTVEAEETYYWHIRSLANIMEIANIYIHSTYQILKFQNKKAGVQKI